MADTKSKAQMLATYTESCFGHVGPMMDAAAELRRLDAVEAERDALRADSCAAKADRIDRLGEAVERLTAERDALRAEVDRLRGKP